MNRLLKGLIVVFVALAAPAFPFATGAESATHVLSSPFQHLPRSRRLEIGAWGGKGISLQVTAKGATVEYDCAHGTIPRGIIPDRRGRFDVSGTHSEERGGPVRQTERLNVYTVRFSGRISGKQMRLTVRNSATKKLL